MSESAPFRLYSPELDLFAERDGEAWKLTPPSATGEEIDIVNDPTLGDRESVGPDGVVRWPTVIRRSGAGRGPVSPLTQLPEGNYPMYEVRFPEVTEGTRHLGPAALILIAATGGAIANVVSHIVIKGGEAIINSGGRPSQGPAPRPSGPFRAI